MEVTVPRVNIADHVDINPVKQAEVQNALKAFDAHKAMTLRYAIGMLRLGIVPAKRPSAAEKARRRAKGKAQRQARKIHRGNA